LTAPRHAEVAGAGIAGLFAASVLAQRGWTVRVHERNDSLREIGAGIVVWQNGVNALREIGALEEVVSGADRVDYWQLRDERNRLMQDSWMLPGTSEAYAVLRTRLHQALATRAQQLDVEIVTGSPVTGATADGELVLDDGRVLQADLVVGADGVNSKVRESLELTQKVTDLRDGCGRHLIPRLPDDPVNTMIERWAGARRIGIFPCSPESVYVYMCCPAKDELGREQTHDRATWIDSFPEFRGYIERIPDGGRWASFSDAVARRWSSGRVAVIGDASHAMSPNLGQAACVGMTNAVALGQALDGFEDITAALDAWERSERSVTDQTQRYSRFYGWIGTHWPRLALDARSALIWALAHSARAQKRINVASRHVPNVTVATTAGGRGSRP
jgi:2-polyprenyl-6-methoxyphenol hydroxylase-like FAD-dependent oxidoreductase